MTPQKIALVQSSFAIAMTKKNPLTAYFYEDLFRASPEMRSVFPRDMHAQRDVLLHALSYCVANLDDLDALVSRTQELTRQHVPDFAEPAHCAAVVETLISAFRRFCGAAFTSQTEQAWLALLNTIANAVLEAMQTPYRKAG